jgi:hypothetical protein
MLVEDGRRHLGDLDQPDLPFQERHDRHLVRRVQGCGIGQAQAARSIGQLNGRKGISIELLERHAPQRGEVESLDTRRESIRERQGELDGQPHVGGGHLGDHAAVGELGDAVDDGLRMHHHVDLAVLEAEQVVRLDHLEPLVHERGRVDGDLRPHLPGGVGQRLLHRCPGQLLP